jgi:hypothetical protein
MDRTRRIHAEFVPPNCNEREGSGLRRSSSASERLNFMDCAAYRGAKLSGAGYVFTGDPMSANWRAAVGLVLLLGCGDDDVTRPPAVAESLYRFNTDQAWIEEGGELVIRIFLRVPGDKRYPTARPIWGTAQPEDLNLGPLAFPQFNDSTGYVRIRAANDGISEGEESLTLSLSEDPSSSGASGAGASINLTIVDRTPSEPAGAFHVPLDPGLAWEYSATSRNYSDGYTLEQWDVTRFAWIERTVEWGGKTWSELRIHGESPLLLRQEGSRLLGVFGGIANRRGPLSERIRSSFPWVIADFDAAPGTSWTEVEVDTFRCPPPENPYCLEAYSAKVITGRFERLATLAGVFPDVRTSTVRIHTYCVECETELESSTTFSFANGVGIVWMNFNGRSRCGRGCPYSEYAESRRVRSWSGSETDASEPMDVVATTKVGPQ